jgi:ATP-dependent DNA helicase RecQ
MDGKHRVLREIFGFEAFRPGQEAIVDRLLGGGHVLAVMPTGSGKSLCFQVPALVNGGLSVVVSPLVALMRDQVEALKLMGVAAGTINSSLPREANIATWERVKAGETRLLYLAPERLMTEPMLKALAAREVKLIAVDEAHCISQWGPSFRPEYEALARLREIFPGVPIGAFTATADEVTRRDIAEKLFGGDCETHIAGFDRPNIRLAVAPKRSSTQQLLDFLDPHRGESGIVYALSRKSTEQWAATLAESGYRAIAYHAGLAAELREDAQNLFMTEKGVVVCATIAFGMGIDKADVRFVFHADLPQSLDAYYQEIGRAGRDGEPAEAHMLFGLEDIRMRRRFIDAENAGDDRKRREHKRLDALVSYCESPGCRRQVLLTYFGESTEPCGNCDVCLNPVETADGTVEAQKILSAVHRTGQRFGAAHIIDVLEGKPTEKIVALTHDMLPTFGIGRDRPRAEWQSLIRQLVAAGHLSLDVAGYGGLSITEKGRALLKGEETFRYRRDMVRRQKKKERRPAAQPTPVLAPASEELFQRLKALRWQLAKERHVPAYVILHDRSLLDMAARRPRSVEDFAQIYGVGAAKVREFAEVFLAAILSSAPRPQRSDAPLEG